jgi:hypothetical protein
VFDGVGDYATNLAHHLAGLGISSSFIVGDPDWAGSGEIEGAPIRRLPQRNGRALVEALRQRAPFEALLVHYVGYGYARRGTPFWLLRGIRRWRRSGGRNLKESTKMLTMYHELWASGRPWQSAFYLHLAQRWIARSLQSISTISITSNLRMQRLMEAPGRPVHVIPIPSNLPALPLAEKAPGRRPPLRVLIFGQLGTRLATLAAHRGLLTELDRRGALKTLVLAGSGVAGGGQPSVDVLAARAILPGERVEAFESTAATELAAQFHRADCYLSSYPASLLGKATTFMAALANGCPAVLPEGADAAPLEAGRHFLVCDGKHEGVDRFLLASEGGELEVVGRTGHDWSVTNANWATVARRIQQFCEIEPY